MTGVNILYIKIVEYSSVGWLLFRSVCKRVQKQCENFFSRDNSGATIFPVGLHSCTNNLTACYSFDFAQQVG